MTGKSKCWRAPVPVIIVGNITAGGTGKTPLVLWLVNTLAELGYSPGVVSRGYGGSTTDKPLMVDNSTSVVLAGDEAVLLAGRVECPVCVCVERPLAVESIVQNFGCDVVVADDGLQHYALARDIEIAVVDGFRGAGNGLPLPAGPLREPVSRLAEVDWVVCSSRAAGLHPDETIMHLRGLRFVHVADGNTELSCETFCARHVNVNAIAGIGNPGRFALTLEDLGLNPLLLALPDHHQYSGAEFEFDNPWPIVCTEKDAVKIRELANVPDVWYLEVDAQFETQGNQSAAARLQSLLQTHGIKPR